MTRRKPDLHVALLRGINVGGKNRLPMKDLAAMFDAAGCRGVTTYIQSGNVVFQAGRELAPRISGLISSRIQEKFGLAVPVVLRTAREIESVARSNPWIEAGKDPKATHVLFLAEEPKDGAAESLDASRSLPDQFVVRGREIFLHCPNGLGRSRLTNDYFDRKLGSISTCRNWTTVLTLAELIREARGSG